MAIELTIRDGDPYWYLSPDIWVVPGTDPTGSPGSPVAGQTAYMWAQVQNAGSTDANGVRIDFYWANPALQVTRSNANFVGSAFADVAAGDTQQALCLVPWSPTIVNNGHECLVAVANHPGDPLPAPLPDAFDPPTYRQVAQRNLTVLATVSLSATTIALTIAALKRADKAVVVTAEVSGSLDEESLASLGLGNLRHADDGVVEIGIARQEQCVGEDQPLGDTTLKMRLPKGTSAAVYATVRARGLAEGQYETVHIVERDDERVLGGMVLVVVGADKEDER